MKHSPRIRKTLKWTSAAMVVVLVVVWAVSLQKSRQVYYRADERVFVLTPHCVCLLPPEIGSTLRFLPSAGLYVVRNPWQRGETFLAWEYRSNLWEVVLDVGLVKVYQLPLWIPLLACAAVWFLLHRRDRRVSRAVCERLCLKCGYDRAGLKGVGGGTAACPECGDVPRG